MPKKILPILILLIAVLLASCASGEVPLEDAQAAQPEAANTATETPVVQEPVETQPVEETQPVAQETVEVDHCEECHVDQQKLIDSADPDKPPQSQSLWGAGTPMEPWEKVLVDAEVFPDSIHGLNGCIDCHGGENDPEKETAHQGIIRNPSRDEQAVCGQCHPNIVASYPNSLHNNLAGFHSALEARSSPATLPALEEMFEGQCQSCHATCGECHVSQPNSVGGGFVDGHLFIRSPSMIQNCNACHGSRVGNEYLGKNDGVPSDVHLSQGHMNCTDCHDGSRMHGEPDDCGACHPGPEDSDIPPPDHRYAGVQTPRCESCHAVVAAGQDDVIMHQMHASTLSCQVCHATSYTSCDGCHVENGQAGSTPQFELDGMELTFLIGRNTQRSYDRPYEYVPVRHAPIEQDSFAAYGANLLPNFDDRATWQYTTPHNIQRRTSQASSCNNCHGNSDLFLTADKLSADELEANRDVIVEQVPAAITAAEQLP